VAAPTTPWGAQGIAEQLTGQQIVDYINGKPLVTGPVAPATRSEAYRADTRTPPSYGQVQINPVYKGTNTTTKTNSGGTTDAQFKQIAEKLGNNWATDLQTAATNGDWEKYNLIQQQVNSILNPVIEKY